MYFRKGVSEVSNGSEVPLCIILDEKEIIDLIRRIQGMDSEVLSIYLSIFVCCLCECLSCNVCVLICVRSVLAVFPEEAGQTETDRTKNRARRIRKESRCATGIHTRQNYNTSHSTYIIKWTADL